LKRQRLVPVENGATKRVGVTTTGGISMKTILASILAVAFLASTPVFAADDKPADKSGEKKKDDKKKDEKKDDKKAGGGGW
jgi:hypothetical protein